MNNPLKIARNILFARACVNAAAHMFDLSERSRFDMLPAMAEVAIQLKSCAECDAQMPDSAAFCPGCGRSMQPEPVPAPKSANLRENFAGSAAYATFMPALAFLFIAPYRRNSFVRFHSVQCLLCWLVGVVVAVLLRLFGLLLLFVPVVGPLLLVLLIAIVAIATLMIWVVLLVKAFQGERFALPVIGALAAQYSETT